MAVPPPPPGSGMQYPQQPGVIQIRMLPQFFGPDSTYAQCPKCRTSVVTVTTKRATIKTHLIAFILCIVCFWPCSLFPYCLDAVRATDHHCPNCKIFLGTYEN